MMSRVVKVCASLCLAVALWPGQVAARCWACDEYWHCMDVGETGGYSHCLNSPSGPCTMWGVCVPTLANEVTVAGTLATSGTIFGGGSSFESPFAVASIGWPSRAPAIVATAWQADCKGRVVNRWMAPSTASTVASQLRVINL